MRFKLQRSLVFWLCQSAGLFITSHAWAQAIKLTDDAGTALQLSRPAQRIISLAPHLTELAFAAGAGTKLVGVDQYSDYPAAALKIKKIGNANALDYEAIVAAKPDLILAWGSGNSARSVARLRQLGLNVWVNEPKNLNAIATSLEAIGVMADTPAVAQNAANDFKQRMQNLSALLARKLAAKPIRYFYQVWHQPLMTLNGLHLVSQALALCGAQNVFATHPALVPTVDIESVIHAQPTVFITGVAGKELDKPKIKTGFELWRPHLKVLHEPRFIVVNGDEMNRHTPRILNATEKLCDELN